MLQLICLLCALIVGYSFTAIKLPLKILNHGLFVIVIAILFVMGYEFGASTNDLWAQLIQIGKRVAVFGGLIFIANVLTLNFILRRANINLRHPEHSVVSANFTQFIVESGKYVLIIIIGITIGLFFHTPLSSLSQLINVLLILLLFIIGYQMRLSGVPLRNVLFNKLGLKVALLVLFSSLFAGVIGAWLLGINLRYGLMLSSGFGWYTLSSILTGQLINQDFGTTAFFIDFSRELAAIILLPSIGRFFPVTMVGYCGATAMDFSLPIIKQNLDERCVLLAISSGMLLSCIVPILIPLIAN